MRPLSLKTRIVTPRLRESRDFYVGTLGMAVVEAWDEPGDVGCILAFGPGRGEAYIELYQGPGGHDFSGLSLQFRTADLAAFLADLPAGAEVRGPVRRPWGSTYLYLTDPNGVPVVVFEGGL